MDKVAPVLGGLATLYVASKVIPVMHPGPWIRCDKNWTKMDGFPYGKTIKMAGLHDFIIKHGALNWFHHFAFRVFFLFYALNTPWLKMLETCGKATNLRVEHDFRLYVCIYMYIYTPYIHTCVNNVPFARITLFQKRWSWRKQDGCRSKLIGSLNLDGPIKNCGRFMKIRGSINGDLFLSHSQSQKFQFAQVPFLLCHFPFFWRGTLCSFFRLFHWSLHIPAVAIGVA